MKKKSGIVVVALLLVSGMAFAEKLEGKKALSNARENIRKAIAQVEKVRGANEYEMGGHGAKAEQALRDALAELNLAVETVKSDAPDAIDHNKK